MEIKDEIPKKIADVCRPGRVAIKIHFGRTKKPGSYLHPEYFNEAKKKSDIVFIDSNTLYGGERSIKKRHLEVARKHGFKPAMILDDNQTTQVYKNIYTFKQLEGFDQVINVAHFTGHKITGFAGCIKNIGMGLVAKRTKLWIHNGMKPKFNFDKCQECGWCADNCEILASKEIEKCTSCALCIGVCKAANFTFGKRVAVINRLAFSAAKAQAQLSMLNICIANNPTVLCDCMGSKAQHMAKGNCFSIKSSPMQADLEVIQHFGRHLFKYYAPGLIKKQLAGYKKYSKEEKNGNN